jgi:hypothetical protein
VAGHEIGARDAPRLDSPLAARARRLVTPDGDGATDGGSPPPARRAPPRLGAPSESDVSGLGAALSDLGLLLGADPAGFAEVASEVAAALSAHAGAGAPELRTLAARFEAAAGSRSIPVLEELGIGAGAGEPSDPRLLAYAGHGAGEAAGALAERVAGLLAVALARRR